MKFFETLIIAPFCRYQYCWFYTYVYNWKKRTKSYRGLFFQTQSLFINKFLFFNSQCSFIISSNQYQPNQTNGYPKKSQHSYQRDLNDVTKSIALHNLESNNSEPNPTSRPTPSSNNPSFSSLNSSYINRLNSLQPTILNGIQEEEATVTNEESSVTAQVNRSSNPMNDSTLFREYQKNKLQIVQQLEEQDRKREELVKQLKCE